MERHDLATAEPPVPPFLRTLMEDYGSRLRSATLEPYVPPCEVDPYPSSTPSSVYGASTSSAVDSRNQSPYAHTFSFSESTSSASSTSSSGFYSMSPSGFSLPMASMGDPSIASSSPTQNLTPLAGPSCFHSTEEVDRDVGVGRSSKPLSAKTPAQSRKPDELEPPDNFAFVAPNVYRSAFPKTRNFTFLKRLGLRTVLTLVLEDYPQQNLQFLSEEGIRFHQIGIPGNKEPFVHIPPENVVAALRVILDIRNHPLLIHCNKGKHRTGCVVGCLRKLQQWSLTAIFDEYRRFSFPKSRSMDQQFMELFDESEVWKGIDYRFLPPWEEMRVPKKLTDAAACDDACR